MKMILIFVLFVISLSQRAFAMGEPPPLPESKTVVVKEASTTTSTLTTTTLTVRAFATPEVQTVSPSTQLLAEESKTVSITLTGTDFEPGASVVIRKDGRANLTGTSIWVSSNGNQILFSVTLPDKGETGALGYWDIVVTNPGGESFSYSNGLRLELPEGDVYFYPIRYSTSGTARIAYSLSSNKAIDIYIYDVREMKVLFHRKFFSGQVGARNGYNEVAWDGKTDFGNSIANGSYVLQVFSNGRMIGQTYFVVVD